MTELNFEVNINKPKIKELMKNLELEIQPTLQETGLTAQFFGKNKRVTFPVVKKYRLIKLAEKLNVEVDEIII